MKNFFLKFGFFYFFYKVLKIFRNSKKIHILESLVKTYLLEDFLKNLKMDYI